MQRVVFGLVLLVTIEGASAAEEGKGAVSSFLQRVDGTMGAQEVPLNRPATAFHKLCEKLKS